MQQYQHQYAPPCGDACDPVRVGLDGLAVVLTEQKPSGEEGMVLHIPLEDYRDEFAVNWRAWVTTLHRPTVSGEPSTAYLRIV